MEIKKMFKKGALSVKHAAVGLITTIITFVVAMNVLGSTIGDVQTAGNTVNATGAPLATLFAGNGVIVLGLMASVLVGLLALAFSRK